MLDNEKMIILPTQTIPSTRELKVLIPSNRDPTVCY